MTEDWKPAANALLGTWPSQVASWGPEVLAAYLTQLAKRGMTPAQAVAAIEACDDRFPPSAGQLAAMTITPHLSGDDVVSLIFDGPRCVLKAPVLYPDGPIYDRAKFADKAAIARADGIDRLLGSFVAQHISWLRRVKVDSDDHAELNRKEVARSWREFVENREGREVAALTSGRGPGELRQLDVSQTIAALGPAAQIKERNG